MIEDPRKETQLRALIVIPTYNEVQNIADLISRILALPPEDIHFHEQETSTHFSTNILVVDDDSSDGTADVVEEIGNRESSVTVMKRKGKLGLGTAYLAGLRYGIDHGYDCIITMDADLSHSPEYVPAILKSALAADLVIGSRYVPGGGVRNWGVHRKILSHGANTLAHLILGLKAHDATSGYRCYTNPLAKKILQKNIVSDGYSFLSEVVFWSEKWCSTVAEVPIVFVNRERGKSKISHKEIFKAMYTLLRLFFARFQ